jgi:LacI family transcriptional regulator
MVMKKKISMTYIASQLHISVTTVSLVLNGKAKENEISQQRIDQVLNYAHTIGYKKSKIKQNVASHQSNIIVLLVEDITNPFFAAVAKSLEALAYLNGFIITCCSTQNDIKKTHEAIKAYSERGVDGFIIAPPPGIEQQISSLMDNGIPVVLFDRDMPSVNSDSVTINNERSTFKATRHLIDNDYNQIAFITVDAEDQLQMVERMQGYEKAMRLENLASNVYKLPFDAARVDMVNAINKIITQNNETDALIFASNRLADCGLEAIRDMGLRIPADIGIVSFDDDNMLRAHTPPITVIEQPVNAIAERVFNLMVARIARLDAKTQNLVLPSKLIIRNSSVAKSNFIN